MKARFTRADDGRLGIRFEPEIFEEQLLLESFTRNAIGTTHEFQFSGWEHDHPGRSMREGLTSCWGRLVARGGDAPVCAPVSSRPSEPAERADSPQRAPSEPSPPDEEWTRAISQTIDKLAQVIVGEIVRVQSSMADPRILLEAALKPSLDGLGIAGTSVDRFGVVDAARAAIDELRRRLGRDREARLLSARVDKMRDVLRDIRTRALNSSATRLATLASIATIAEDGLAQSWSTTPTPETPTPASATSGDPT